MKTANAVILLKENIVLLEIEQEQNRLLLKEEFKQTFDALRPANLFKNTFHELTDSPDFKNNLVDSVIGIVTGFISKKIIVGNTHNPLKQIMGVLLQLTVTSMVTKNADSIKSSIMEMIGKFTNNYEATDEV